MITRDLGKAANTDHDLVVIGGGIYGACLALEASRRGLRPLLIERGDFGQATSWNSLRIIHGGLRYLQQLDLHRFFESVGERRWFLRHFPDLVKPLRCLMPLYGNGIRRPSIFRAALAANDVLSCRRNKGVCAGSRLPAGRVLRASETVDLFPAVDREGLRGGALWYDGVMRNSQRVLMEILRWACTCGATALNYVEASKLRQDAGKVTGVEAVDRETGRPLTFDAPAVVNCAGPWCRELGRKFDRDVEALFRPSLAFSVLLDRKPIAQTAVAVAPKHPQARTYFVLPWEGRVLAGTYHAPWSAGVDRPKPPEQQLDRLLADLSEAVPGLNVCSRDVLRIYAGLLPAAAAGSDVLAVREVIIDHGNSGGPSGLFSVSGVKFTTARLVAENTLRRICASQRRDLQVYSSTDRPPGADWLELDSPPSWIDCDGPEPTAKLQRLINEEAVLHLDDLLLRRTDWGANQAELRKIGEATCDRLGWDPARREQELQRVDCSLACGPVDCIPAR